MAVIKKVCVAGAGLMGRQIALNTALYPYEVTLVDSIPAVVEDAKKWIEKFVAGRVEKGKLTADQAKNIKLTCYNDLKEAAADSDLVIEAILEDPEIKKQFFKLLGTIVRQDTIIATNSSRMVSSLFKDLIPNPSRLCNLHYFHPATVMKLTEVVQGPHTSVETAQAMVDFSTNTGKRPIWLKKEIDGFVVNRLLAGINKEAFYLVENGVCTPQEIDIGAENGLNYPMGPYRLMDFSGLDLAFLVLNRTLEETGTKPLGYDIIKEKYNKGEYGVKSGKGFYDYKK